MALTYSTMLPLGTKMPDFQLKNVKANAILNSHVNSVFKNLRTTLNINDEDILTSIDPSNNQNQIFKTNVKMREG